MTYEVKKICACEILDDKNVSRTVFRIVRLGKDNSYRNLDFEAPHVITSERHWLAGNHMDLRLEH